MRTSFNIQDHADIEPIIRCKDIGRVIECCGHFQRVAAQRNGILAAVIKADGYGFGISHLVETITEKGINHVYTSDISEAHAIRMAGFHGELFILNGFFPYQSDEFDRLQAQPVLTSRQQILEFQAHTSKAMKRLSCAIHFDTGMNRNGLSSHDVQWLKNNFDDLSKHLNIHHYLTHLHSVEEDIHADQTPSIEQIQRMRDIKNTLPIRPTSILATHGVLFLDDSITADFQSQIYRVGIGLQGDIYDQDIAVQVYARINETRTLNKGESIGYDQTYKANAQDMRIAIVEIGYGDGYSRMLNVSNDDENDPNRPYMVVHGHQCPVVGKISMNMTAIDISSLPADIDPVHDFAEVVGPNVDIRKLAEYGDTASEELLIDLQSGNRRAKDIILPKPTRT